MIQSMTGYGKSICDLDDKTVTIEVKALNSKQLDIYTRIPSVYREKDLEMRNIISQRLKRGKVELSVAIEITDAKNSGTINIPVVKEYYQQLKELGSDLGIDYNDSILSVIMRLPESLKLGKDELDADEWKKVVASLNKALDSVQEFRKQEGSALKKDILSKADSINSTIELLKPYEEERMNFVRQRLTNGLNELKEVDKVDTNRFEQELVYYLEKLDINEEKVRLKNHCSFFKEVVEYNEPVGKKLGFIAQEMGREINTIGSKANNTDIQRLVVSMKDELEKIKEQSLNIL